MKESSLGDKVRIEHILQAISEIKNYVRGIDFEEFSINSMILNACLRQLEVVGEASNRITKELRIIQSYSLERNYCFEKYYCSSVFQH